MNSKARITVATLWGKILSIVGYAGSLFFLLGGIIVLTDKNTASDSKLSAFIVVVIFVAIGILFIAGGLKIKRRIRRFKSYVGIISLEGVTSLDVIATKTNQSVNFIRNDLQKMIDKKYFTNAYIDKDNNEIVIAAEKTQTQYAQPVITNTENVNCKSCGAMNTKQSGTVSYCEYCGSPI